MFFLQAAQAPVLIRQGEIVYSVPKMTMDELVQWGTEVASERAERAMENMDDSKRREYLTFYPVMAPDLQAMGQLARTADGIRRILKTCMSREDVTAKHYKTGAPAERPTVEQIEQWIRKNGAGRLANLAWELADLNDNSMVNPDDQQEDNRDPLTWRGKAGSANSPATGQKI